MANGKGVAYGLCKQSKRELYFIGCKPGKLAEEFVFASVSVQKAYVKQGYTYNAAMVS